MIISSRLGFLLILLCAVSSVSASGTFKVTTDIREAHNLVFQLRLEEAQASVKAIQRREPNNLMAHYVADFADFFTVFISDDPDKYQAIKTDRDMRMKLVSLGDISSPYYLYVQAEIYIHRAMLRLKFEENFAAAADLNQAFKLLKRNQKKFPAFAPNLKSLGMLKAAFGTIPDHYRWAIELLSSMEGTVGEGMADLETALKDKQSLSFRETQYCYIIAMMYYQNNPEKALEYARNSGLRPVQNPFDCFVLSHVALKSGNNDLALQWIEGLRQSGLAKKIPHLDLMYGTAKLYRLDKDADVPLLRFLETFQGKNYRKEALQKLAWHSLMQGNLQGYEQYMRLCRQSGCAVSESDKYALAESMRTNPPHTGLLRARLLFDGGYFLPALKEVESIRFDELTGAGQLEYQYRYGRICKSLGREYDALFAYKTAISMGQSSREYFGCAAALQTGMIYEQKGERDNAQHYYQICLQMNPDEFKSGLHQKAKAGMSRLRVPGNTPVAVVR